MKTRRMSYVTVTCLALALAVGIGGTLNTEAQTDKKKKKARKEKVERNQDNPVTLMEAKLDHAQEILDGLAHEDFQKITKAGKALKAISALDQFKKYNTLAYNELSAEFRNSTDRMLKAARADNLDGATLGYLQLTVSCVECHKLIRDGGLIKGLESID